MGDDHAAFRLIQADARRIPLADRSVHCCVTSPPYWGLRNYGADGQLGLEKTPKEYVENMVGVFREVRRVLRPDGTLWLNLGDSYCNAGSRNNGGGLDGNRRGGVSDTDGTWAGAKKSYGDIRHTLKSFGIKHKDLIGIPWMVALALRSDGWHLRSEIIWNRTNSMPEKVFDRPTKSHEQIFLLSKGRRYWYDADAIRESGGDDGGRNSRSVWTIAVQPFRGAHFATFPPGLPERCIKAGCPAGGVVLDPFNGSGTTGVVATGLNRRYIGLDVNPDYLAMAEKRISRPHARIRAERPEAPLALFPED